MRKRFLLLIIMSSILVLAIGGGFLWLFFPLREEVLIISDNRYIENHIPVGEQWKLRFSLASIGKKLSMETIEFDTLGDPDNLDTLISDSRTARTSLIVFSPLITSDIVLHQDVWTQRLSQLHGEGISSVGIGVAPEGLFDLLFTYENSSSGWSEAAKALSLLSKDNPLPTVLLYTAGEVNAEANARLFEQHYKERVLEVLPVSLSTRAAIDTTVEKLSDMGALYVVSPYVEGLAQYASETNDQKIRWIVDASYTPVIQRRNLEGVVADDLGASLVELFSSGFENRSGGVSIRSPLFTTYRSMKRAW
ncbi:hypothetical protein [Pleomorphochaeta sp. DL1XJH-081]|uniref:hypothetical protein n=1 Tax=Pleomorphochaeta sp. DL1XJH-081 TaxID=3409690 RepID=UPI003BB53038